MSRLIVLKTLKTANGLDWSGLILQFFSTAFPNSLRLFPELKLYGKDRNGNHRVHDELGEGTNEDT